MLSLTKCQKSACRKEKKQINPVQDKQTVTISPSIWMQSLLVHDDLESRVLTLLLFIHFCPRLLFTANIAQERIQMLRSHKSNALRDAFTYESDLLCDQIYCATLHNRSVPSTVGSNKKCIKKQDVRI